MTENGDAAQFDDVRPIFGSLAVTDVWTPNDRLLINLGARVDNFVYKFDNTVSGFPARAFWFNAFNNENCGAPGAGSGLAVERQFVLTLSGRLQTDDGSGRRAIQHRAGEHVVLDVLAASGGHVHAQFR